MSANGDPADRTAWSRSGRAAAPACMSFLWTGGRQRFTSSSRSPIHIYVSVDGCRSALFLVQLRAACRAIMGSAVAVQRSACAFACSWEGLRVSIVWCLNGGKANFASPAHAASMHATQVRASWLCVRRGERRLYSRADARIPVCSGAGETSTHGSLASETGTRAGRGILPHAGMAAHGSAVLSRGHAGRRQAAPLQKVCGLRLHWVQVNCVAC